MKNEYIKITEQVKKRNAETKAKLKAIEEDIIATPKQKQK